MMGRGYWGSVFVTMGRGSVFVMMGRGYFQVVLFLITKLLRYWSSNLFQYAISQHGKVG